MAELSEEKVGAAENNTQVFLQEFFMECVVLHGCAKNRKMKCYHHQELLTVQLACPH